jgi:hypothetical protein
VHAQFDPVEADHVEALVRQRLVHDVVFALGVVADAVEGGEVGVGGRDGSQGAGAVLAGKYGGTFGAKRPCSSAL